MIGRISSFHPALYAAILMAAFVLSLYHLTTESVWQPESALIARTDIDTRADAGLRDRARQVINQVMTVAREDVSTGTAPLYPLTMIGWRQLTGDSLFALRYLSLLSDVLVVAATMTITRTLVNRRAAWAAGVLLAVSGYTVFYSRDASPAIFGLAFLTVALARLLTARGWLGRLFAVGLIVAAFYVAYPFGLIGIVLIAAIPFVRSIPRRQLAVLIGLTLVGIAPWFILTRANLALADIATPIHTPLDLIALVSGGAPALWAIIIAVGFVGWRRLNRGALFLLAWAVLSLVPLIVLPVDGALFIPLAVVLAIVGGATLTADSVPRLLTGGMLLVAVGVLSGQMAFTFPEKVDYDDWIRAIALHREPFAPLVIDLPADHPALFTRSQAELTRGIVLRLGWDGAPAPETIAPTLADSPEIWLIGTADSAQFAEMIDTLSTTHTVTSDSQQGTAELVVLTRLP